MGRTNSGAYFFGGLLDEVAVYATALSSERIRAHYEAGRAIDRVSPVVTLVFPRTAAAPEARHRLQRRRRMQPATRHCHRELFAGNDALGTPLQTLSATRRPAPIPSTHPLPSRRGLHGSAQQSDGGGNRGRSSANTFSVDAPAPSPTAC